MELSIRRTASLHLSVSCCRRSLLKNNEGLAGLCQQKDEFGTKPCPRKMRKKPATLNDRIIQDDWALLTQYCEILELIWQFT